MLSKARPVLATDIDITGLDVEKKFLKFGYILDLFIIKLSIKLF